MKIIKHRVNTLRELGSLPSGLGAEIDLRSSGSKIILQHEPFLEGDSFEAYLDRWCEEGQRGTLILNPKEDGLEGMALQLLSQRGIKDFFFLDLSIPTTVRLSLSQGVRALAVRVSEYELVSSAQHFSGKVDWVWVDCFTGNPAEASLVDELKKNFKVCLVSPELQGYPPDRMAAFLPLASKVDAVCTKYPELWGEQ